MVNWVVCCHIVYECGGVHDLNFTQYSVCSLSLITIVVVVVVFITFCQLVPSADNLCI